MSREAATRRAFLGRCGVGFGAAALTSLLAREHAAAAGSGSGSNGLPGFPQLPVRAKRVIYLYMSGGPSHLETFDPKPELARLHGQPMPDSFTRGQQIAQLQGQRLACFAPQFPFRRWGKSGHEITEIFPHLGSVADELAIIRSMSTDAINHDPANTLMNTGTMISGRPSMGSWVLYGLGSLAEDLPGFVVLTSQDGRSPQPISQRMWHSGFLPGKFQGVPLRSRGAPVLYLERPGGVSPDRQADVINAVSRLNRAHDTAVHDPEIATRIAQYEMAFRMQTSVPGLVDLASESPAMLKRYGCEPGDGSFASNCLLARRLAERGVRFIQLYHRGWDHHNDLVKFIQGNARNVDQATAALITDLKERGLLDDTLIVWGGEFGRPGLTPEDGKDETGHNANGFTFWLAGGRVKGGHVHGRTDDTGARAVDGKVHFRDLHATILHLMGLRPNELTYHYAGRDHRLTGPEGGQVVSGIIA